ncbi:MAG: Fe-S cluster assembly protein HesB [Acidimicrobiia bacterium]|nr:Fe-S cluster assembly protein HesB [Acidimicrobiia bacterium]
MPPAHPTSLPFTDDEAANRLLAGNSFALLVGMLLDQQFPMEAAFRGPRTLEERIGPYDAARVATLDPADLDAAFRTRPAIHRYPGSMAERTHKLAVFLVDEYGGDPEALWNDAADGAEVYRRLRALPGFGERKARIFVGVLGKRLGVTPRGWEEEAADWPSIADVDTFERVSEIREQKRAMKKGHK